MQQKRYKYLGVFAVLLAIDNSFAQADLSEEYKTRCSFCHDTGYGMAPRFGVRYDWVDRLKYGEQAIALRSMAGYGRMPAKGGSLEISDEQYLALAHYLLASVTTDE